LRDLFLKFERGSTALATAGACAMLATAAALGLWQIITRFVIQQPAEWTEVLIRFSLIWMVFLGIAQAFRIGAMVSVLVGWQYAQRGRVQTVIGLEDVSMFWAYLALPVGGVFAAVAVVGHWLDPKRLELETAQ
jgi:TRAP-type C4-dicarboxylate transport system permease small subunit